MHMADALLSPAVGGAMCAVSVGAMAYSVTQIKKDDLSEKKVPIMGVAGALVFAAQMINYTIPATGSSGHIGGGILLAGLLGGFPALLTIAAVLIIQCLFFADGGLLALGCNIFNMGVIPCLVIYPLLVKPILKKGISYTRLTVVSILGVIIALQLGAFSVVLETTASGITTLPFGTFVVLMQPIHLAIGAIEGVITAAILCFVYNMRPEILESALESRAIASGVSMKKILIVLAVLALIIGGGLSLLASENPDGLEWAIENITGSTEIEPEHNMDTAAAIVDATAFMPDYDFASAGETGSLAGTTVAGIVGGVMTFVLAGASALVITKSKKKPPEPA